MKRAACDLANCERPRGDRPAPTAPLVPDLVPVERPWLGSATGEVLRWKRRALAAEAELARLVGDR